MSKIPYSAFTNTYSGITNMLTSSVTISLPEINEGVEMGNVFKGLAIWDTGATNTVITSKVVKELALKPISKKEVHTANGIATANVYLTDIILPNNVRISGVSVTDCDKLTGEFEVLIGMDIIKMSDFSVTNSGGKTIMSFGIPSRKTTDYVKQVENEQRQQRGLKNPFPKYSTSKKHRVKK